MEIVNVRIDERLIHGQVAAVWTNTLNATRIMVIDDMAAKDEIQKIALKMACPSTVKLSILPAEKAADRLKSEAYPTDRIFVVLKGPKTIKQIADAGYMFPVVNVGNMSNKHGSTQVKRSVSVTPEDVAAFRELNDRGIKFTAQMVPTEEKIDFMPLIKDL